MGLLSFKVFNQFKPKVGVKDPPVCSNHHIHNELEKERRVSTLLPHPTWKDPKLLAQLAGLTRSDWIGIGSASHSPCTHNYGETRPQIVNSWLKITTNPDRTQSIWGDSPFLPSELQHHTTRWHLIDPHDAPTAPKSSRAGWWRVEVVRVRSSRYCVPGVG
jgi:hypothetical protein